MFTNKKKHDKIWDIFQILLFKIPKYPTNIGENDIINLYKRAITIYEGYENLQYIYDVNGEIDNTIYKNMVIEE